MRIYNGEGKIIDYYTFLTRKDDKEAIDLLQREFEENLESKLKEVRLVPKSVEKYYCPKTGRHKELGIPYSSPP
jgi:hypothetical protein